MLIEEEKKVLNPATNVYMTEYDKVILKVTKLLGEDAYETDHFFYPEVQLVSCSRLARKDIRLRGRVSTLFEKEPVGLRPN